MYYNYPHYCMCIYIYIYIYICVYIYIYVERERERERDAYSDAERSSPRACEDGRLQHVCSFRRWPTPNPRANIAPY